MSLQEARWAKPVTPAIIQRLMRHANIDTTMKYYLDQDADEVARELWQGFGGVGTSVGTCSKSSESVRGLNPQETKEALEQQGLQ